MIDVLFKSYLIRKKPVYGVLLGFFFVIVGSGFGFLIFHENPSFPSILLTTLAAAPIMIRLIEIEKWEPKHEKVAGKVLQRHKNVIEAYFNLFFGMAIAFAILYIFLPEGISNLTFSEQTKKFVSGFFIEPKTVLSMILLNNIGLLFLFFLLSLFYGSGSIFLLSWNASILGVMWGRSFKSIFISGISLVFIKNTLFAFPYLLPEILAYFLASVAGGIVSVNLTKKRRIKTAMLDSLLILGISVIIILISGLVEVLMGSYFV